MLIRARLAATTRRKLIILVIALGFVLAACGGDTEELVEHPGEGTTVSMARADWDTGYFQAEVYRQLLGELGYDVTDPGDAEMAPDVFYPLLGSGDFDLWVNGWFPFHHNFISDAAAVSVVGNEIPAGGLQGFFIDKATAGELDIKRLDDIGNDPAVAQVFDLDGDGRADLMGCNEGWGCHDIINRTIEANGWGDTVQQVSGDYNELWDETVARFEAGEPVLAYTWSPSAYIAELIFGDDIVWMSLTQPLPEEAGAALLSPAHCPGQPCETGFLIADIRVVANTAFLDQNPAAARLLEQVGFNLIDIALQNLKMRSGEDTPDDLARHAAEYIAENRGVMDLWLDEARRAATP
jgi:glycine betaine/proline transport system substrate-binding protein